jgi:8-oxo-dGTP pyrophosphatase MutT (NUDIX family)
LHRGKIGLFGGHRDRYETYQECAMRELHEEIGYGGGRSILASGQA